MLYSNLNTYNHNNLSSHKLASNFNAQIMNRIGHPTFKLSSMAKCKF
uniref:Uncharacterized protein n=1 Tax=Rhizophora mucronata TaxID=61149 RepID=A0A2P2NGC9_RHIMU